MATHNQSTPSGKSLTDLPTEILLNIAEILESEAAETQGSRVALSATCRLFHSIIMCENGKFMYNKMAFYPDRNGGMRLRMVVGLPGLLSQTQTPRPLTLTQHEPLAWTEHIYLETSHRPDFIFDHVTCEEVYDNALIQATEDFVDTSGISARDPENFGDLFGSYTAQRCVNLQEDLENAVVLFRLERFNNLKSITIHGGAVTMQGAFLCQSAFTNLTRVEIFNIHPGMIEAGEFVVWLLNLQSLEYLFLKEISLHMANFLTFAQRQPTHTGARLGDNISNIKHLNFTSSQFESVSLALAVLKCCRRLESCALVDMWNNDEEITDPEVVAFHNELLKHKDSLRQLALSCRDLRDPGFLRQFTALEEFHIREADEALEHPNLLNQTMPPNLKCVIFNDGEALSLCDNVLTDMTLSEFFSRSAYANQDFYLVTDREMPNCCGDDMGPFLLIPLAMADRPKDYMMHTKNEHWMYRVVPL